MSLSTRAVCRSATTQQHFVFATSLAIPSKIVGLHLPHEYACAADCQVRIVQPGAVLLHRHSLASVVLTNVDERPIIQWLWTGNITENSPSTTHAVAGLCLVDTYGPDRSCGGWACAVGVSVSSSPPGVLQLQAGNAGLVTSGVPVDYETRRIRASPSLCASGPPMIAIGYVSVEVPICGWRYVWRSHTPSEFEAALGPAFGFHGAGRSA